MKRSSLGLALGLMAAAGLQAQTAPVAPAPIVPSTPGVAATATPAEGAVLFNDAQLQQMLGAIALYPDALIALILTSATEPSDVVLAARLLPAKPTEAQIDAQPWSESVRALARYPDVVTWMDANLAWTRQVGGAFLAQPADVMNAVQQLRAQARAVGTLDDTPEQRVVVEQQIIRIEPATNVIYVPYYDPTIVYVRRPLGLRSSYFRFSSGYSSNVWVSYDFDWSRRTVVVVNGGYPSRPHNYYPQPPRPGYPQGPRYPDSHYHPWTPPTPRPRVYQTAPRGDHPGRPQQPPAPGMPPRPLNPAPPSRVNLVPTGPRTPVPGQRFQSVQPARPGVRPNGLYQPNQFIRPAQPSAQPPVQSSVQPSQPPTQFVRPNTDWGRPQGPRVSPPARIQQGPQTTRPPTIFSRPDQGRPSTGAGVAPASGNRFQPPSPPASTTTITGATVIGTDQTQPQSPRRPGR